jgi:hypothetical protein
MYTPERFESKGEKSRIRTHCESPRRGVRGKGAFRGFRGVGVEIHT